MMEKIPNSRGGGKTLLRRSVVVILNYTGL
jgi:hypothetical protein